MNNVQIDVLHSSEYDGATWYYIRVRENHQEWLVQKRFDHFVDFDSELASKGLFGLREALRLQGFMERRLQALAAYMAHLAGQLQSLSQVCPASQVPALQRFLSPPRGGTPVVLGTPVGANHLAAFAVESAAGPMRSLGNGGGDTMG
eukprot:Skav227506  [mRNA]  locus=scaffold282:261544:262489:+ [translate_table: standard]